MGDTIPQKYIELGEAIAKLARDADLRRMTVSLSPGFGMSSDDWRSPITIHWEQGRHGADSFILNIESTVTLRHKAERP